MKASSIALEKKPTLAGGICKCFDSTVIQKTIPVKNN
jgi:hypothetical protein